MHHFFHRLALSLAGVVLWVTCLMPTAAHAAAVTVVASAGSVSVGDVFSVRLRVQGLTAGVGDSLGGFDASLLYNAAVVSFTGASFIDGGSALNQLDFPEPGSFGFLGSAVNGVGSVRVSGLSSATCRRCARATAAT